MSIYLSIYFLIGLVVAIFFIEKEAKKIMAVDNAVANVFAMFVLLLWPVVLFLWLINWVNSKLYLK